MVEMKDNKNNKKEIHIGEIGKNQMEIVKMENELFGEFGIRNEQNKNDFVINFIDYKLLSNIHNDMFIITNDYKCNNGLNIFSLSKNRIAKTKYKTREKLYKIIQELVDEKCKNLIKTICINKLDVFVNYNIDFNKMIFLNFEFINQNIPLYVMVRDTKFYVTYFKILDNYKPYQKDIANFNTLFATPCLWQYKKNNNTLIDWLNSLPSFKIYHSVIKYRHLRCCIINKSDTDSYFIKHYFNDIETFSLSTKSTYVKGFYQEVTPLIN